MTKGEREREREREREGDCSLLLYVHGNEEINDVKFVCILTHREV